MSKSVDEMYKEFEAIEKEKAEKRNKKIKLSLFVLFAIFIGYKFFIGDVSYIKSYKIYAHEIGVTSTQQLYNSFKNYRLQNENVLKILEKHGLTFDEFISLVTVETVIMEGDDFFEIEFISNDTSRDWEPLYIEISQDFLEFSRANKPL